jgi:hypothetical protein
LNANGVAVGSTGNVTWTITPADNAIVTTFDPRYPERHRAVFDFEWASGAKRWWNSVDLVVTREPAIVSTST